MDFLVSFMWRHLRFIMRGLDVRQPINIRSFSFALSGPVFALVMPLAVHAQGEPESGQAVSATATAAANAPAAYQPVLKPYETIVQTSDGCKHISSRYIEIGGYVLTPYDAMRYYTWYGACVNGFSLGPGLYFFKSDTQQNIARVWSFYGRPIGDIVDVVDERSGENGFAWDGDYYALSNDNTHIVHAAPGVRHSYRVSSLFCKDSSGDRVDYCIKEYHGGETHHVCKSMEDCARKLTKFPLYAEYQKFASQHQADVEAAQRSIDPQHVTLIQAKLNELPAIEQKLYESTADYRAKRDAERQQADARWNQYVAERDQQRATERKQSWNKLLSGVAAMAGATAAYGEARSGGSSKGDAQQAAAKALGGGAGQSSGTGPFPNDIEYVNGPGLQVNEHYKPMGCVVWVQRPDYKKEAYDLQNNCRYKVDVYFGPRGPYSPDKDYSGPSYSTLYPGKTRGLAYSADARGAVLACLEVDSLLRRRKGELEGVPDYDGYICKKHHSTNGGPTGTAR